MVLAAFKQQGGKKEVELTKYWKHGPRGRFGRSPLNQHTHKKWFTQFVLLFGVENFMADKREIESERNDKVGYGSLV